MDITPNMSYLCMNFSVFPTNLSSNATKIDVMIQYATYYPIISALGSKYIYAEVSNLCCQPRFDLDRKYDNNDLQFKFVSKSERVNLGAGVYQGNQLVFFAHVLPSAGFLKDQQWFDQNLTIDMVNLEVSCQKH